MRIHAYEQIQSSSNRGNDKQAGCPKVEAVDVMKRLELVRWSSWTAVGGLGLRMHTMCGQGKLKVNLGSCFFSEDKNIVFSNYFIRKAHKIFKYLLDINLKLSNKTLSKHKNVISFTQNHELISLRHRTSSETARRIYCAL